LREGVVAIFLPGPLRPVWILPVRNMAATPF
jgi:hypothetical protein